VWHARQDFRQAQSAAKRLEQEYGLTEAPRQRAAARTRTPAQVEREGYREKQAGLSTARAEELAGAKAAMARLHASYPSRMDPSAVPPQSSDIMARLKASRHLPDNERGRDRDNER
jgi:hypothetical protein